MGLKNGKPCTKCGTSEWNKWGHCRQCDRMRGKRWREKNPDGQRDRSRQWREKNPEKQKELNRRWIKENPEKRKEQKRRNQRAHPDKARERSNRWRKNNRDKMNAQNHRRRTSQTQAGGSYTAQEWQALCKQYSYACLRCGKQKPNIKLTADHVLPVALGGSSDIDNIQPLCLSCNSWKHDKYIDFRTKPGVLRWIQGKLFG